MKNLSVLLAILLCYTPVTVAVNYFPFYVDQDHGRDMLGLSSLNQPITDHDRIRVTGDHFTTERSPKVRLFGANLAFAANFPTPKDAQRIAQRLAALGMNAVRMIGLDRSTPLQGTTYYSLLDTRQAFPAFNPEAVKRLNHFLDALQQAGIYVVIPLQVSYHFDPQTDHMPELYGLRQGQRSKPLAHFAPAMQQARLRYIEQLFSQLQLKKRPNIALMEVANESSLLYIWQRRQLYTQLKGKLRTLFLTLWLAFQRHHGVAISDELPQAAWQHPTPRQQSFVAFLNQLDQRWFEQVRQRIHKLAGRTLPVTGSQMLFTGLSGMDSQSHMDYIDSHRYLDAYRTHNGVRHQRLLRLDQHEGLKQLALASWEQVAGKPFVLSEFNIPWPNPYSASALPVFAAHALRQGWDGLFFFAYAHRRQWERTVPVGFNLLGDQAKLSMMRQTAWLFRHADLPPATALPIGLTRTERLQAGAMDINGWNLNRILKKWGLPLDLPLQYAISLHDALPGQTRTLPPSIQTCGPLSPLCYDARAGKISWSGHYSAGFFGQLTRHVSQTVGPFTLSTTEDGYRQILLTSLDNKPLKTSKHLLLSMPGAVWRGHKTTGSGWQLQTLQRASQHPGEWRLQDAVRPANPIMERRPLRIRFAHHAAQLTLYPLDNQARRLNSKHLSNHIQAGQPGFTLVLPGSNTPSSPWYEWLLGPKMEPRNKTLMSADSDSPVLSQHTRDRPASVP